MFVVMSQTSNMDLNNAVLQTHQTWYKCVIKLLLKFCVLCHGPGKSIIFWSHILNFPENFFVVGKSEQYLIQQILNSDLFLFVCLNVLGPNNMNLLPLI